MDNIRLDDIVRYVDIYYPPKVTTFSREEDEEAETSRLSKANFRSHDRKLFTKAI